MTRAGMIKRPQAFADRVGVSHVDGKYVLTGQDMINEGADKLLELGTRVIKLWFAPTYERDYRFNTNWPQIRSLVEMAQHPYYRDVFAKPFTTIVLETIYDYGGIDWKKGMSDEQVANLRQQYYELASYLLTAYKGSGKTFLLQNWEGDNHLEQNASDTAVQGMIRWLNARQDGVDQAREEHGMDGVVAVNAIEVNKINTGWSGPRVIDAVVPHTHADLYSYSNWETGRDAELLKRNLDYIASKAPASKLYGDKNVYMGEYGTPEKVAGSDEQQLEVNRLQTETALEWGAVYAIYWQLYCNEPIGISHEERVHWTGQATTQNMKGFWLYRPDGSQTAFCRYLQERCRKG